MNSLLAKYSSILKKDKLYSTAILILRLLVGFAFILHGWGKIQNPMSWMGPEAPVPGVFQLLSAVAEFGGGIAWMLGLLTPLASLGLIFNMIVAASTHIQRGDPFVGNPPSYELALVYLVIAILLLLAGPGKYSADYKLFSR